MKPISYKKFQFAVKLFDAAAQMLGPFENPQQYGVTVDGEIITFADTAMNRGMIAIKDIFPDRDEYVSAGMRIMFLSQVVEHPEVLKLNVVRTESCQVHDSVLMAMAEVPINEQELDWVALVSLIKKYHSELENS